MAARPGGLSEQRREPLHPPVDGDVVNLDAAFGEQLLDIAVGEAKAQVPADRQHDHIRREAETGEGRLCNGIGVDVASSHDTILAGRSAHSRCNSASGATTATIHPTATASSLCAVGCRCWTVLVDRPDRIHRWYEIVDELTDQTGLVTSELVPAFRATGPDLLEGGLHLSNP